MEVWATMQQAGDGRWRARTREQEPVEATGDTPQECVGSLRRRLLERRAPSSSPDLTLVVEVLPVLAGVAEAAEVMGWDKRRVITYIDRGRFPAPLQSLASGRVWARAVLEQFAREWRARQERRRRPGRRGVHEGVTRSSDPAPRASEATAPAATAGGSGATSPAGTPGGGRGAGRGGLGGASPS